ncbi:hypothetical protein L6164_031862 [Bauhinia variegata]|uniref:Uncharacterized protein n=1 Tax=Bauhinia variegata TaxID=167791 RepID=A0ACB9KLW2_BAUVA|nr:hypothetical protein L6164_031862 [Bauhinia variegata]
MLRKSEMRQQKTEKIHAVLEKTRCISFFHVKVRIPPLSATQPQDIIFSGLAVPSKVNFAITLFSVSVPYTYNPPRKNLPSLIPISIRWKISFFARFTVF